MADGSGTDDTARRFLAPGPMTALDPDDHRLRPVAPTPEAVAAALHGVLVHEFLGGLYGVEIETGGDAVNLHRAGDVLDLGRDEFVVAGDAWLGHRDGTIDADTCGLSVLDEHGDWWIAGNLLRDVASLLGVETRPWDVWGAMREPGDPAAPAEPTVLRGPGRPNRSPHPRRTGTRRHADRGATSTGTKGQAFLMGAQASRRTFWPTSGKWTVISVLSPEPWRSRTTPSPHLPWTTSSPMRKPEAPAPDTVSAALAWRIAA